MNFIDDLIENLTDNVKKDIKSFDDLVDLSNAKDRQIYIGDIEVGIGATADAMIRFWNKYDNDHNIPIEERKPIKMYIDSNGGSLCDAFTIIDSILLSQTPVWTIVTGSAYSGGFFISICGDKRYAYPHSSFMMHEGSTQTGGDSHKFVNYSKFYIEELKQLKEHVLNMTKITESKYEENRRDDWWFTSKEALDKGIVDEIVSELI